MESSALNPAAAIVLRDLDDARGRDVVKEAVKELVRGRRWMRSALGGADDAIRRAAPWVSSREVGRPR